MRAPANPPASQLGRLAKLIAALLLAASLTTASAFADEAADGAIDELTGESDNEPTSEPLGDSTNEPEGQPGSSAPTLASYLASGSLRVSADVELADDPEPVLGSFTVDGLTYAVTGEGEACLVAVAPGTLAGGLAGGSSGAEGAGRGVGSGWTTSSPRSAAEQVPSGAQPLPAPSAEASGTGEDDGAAGGPDGMGLAHIAGSAAAALLSDDASVPDAADSAGSGDGPAGPDADGVSELATLALPGTVSFDGSEYSLASVGPRALAGCTADVVVVPASVASVDPTALSGCSASAIEVDAANPNLASFDGMLFDAGLTSLLLVPEGKQGAARVPETAEGVLADALSHSGDAGASSAGAGGAVLTSRNGSLYDESGQTLVWSPDMADGLSPDASALEGASCEVGALPAASLGSAAASRGNNKLTLSAGGGTIYQASKKDISTATLTKRADGYQIDCGCNYMKARLMEGDGYPGAICYHHGTASTSAGTKLYFLWVKAGYKVTGFRDAANPGENFELTDTFKSLADATTGKGKARTLEPTWSPQDYSIELDAHGGAFELPSGDGISWLNAYASFTYREGLRISDLLGMVPDGLELVAPKGKRLAGWRLYVNGSASGSTKYSPGGSVVNFLPDDPFATSDDIDVAVARKQSVALQAQWDSYVNLAWMRASDSYEITTQVVPEGPGATAPKTLQLPSAPTRAGYTFKGWYTASSGGEQVTSSTAVPSSNTAYYAQWERIPTLTFDGQGGTAYQRTLPGNVEAQAGATVSATSPTLITHVNDTNVFTSGYYYTAFRPGYAFAGWSLSKSGGAILSGPSGKNDTIKLTADTTVYAQWRELSYRLIFDGQGGTAHRWVLSGDGQALSGATVSVSAPFLITHTQDTNVFASSSGTSYFFAADRDGYTFRGWSLSKSGGAILSGPEGGDDWIKLTADTTVYAQWKPNKATLHANGHPLSYVDNGAQAVARQLAADAAMETGFSRAYVWEGTTMIVVDDPAGGRFLNTFRGTDGDWLFRGWATQPSSATVLEHPWSSSQDGLHLYAQWAPCLTLDGNAGGEALLRLSDGQAVQSKRWEGIAAWGLSEGKVWVRLPSEEVGPLRATVEPRAGYSFEGWAKGPDAKEPDPSLTWGTEGLSAWAVWRPEVYRAALDAQGGTGGATEYFQRYGEGLYPTAECSSPLERVAVPTKPSFRFLGYFTERGGRGVQHVDAAGRLTQGATALASDATLYAHWVAEVVTVHANGHALAWSWQWRASGDDPVTETDSGTMAPGETKSVQSERFYAADYGYPALIVDEVVPQSWFGFKNGAPGWTLRGFSLDAGSSELLRVGETRSGTADVYAQWEANRYAVAFDANGGTGGPTGTVQATFDSAMPAFPGSQPTRERHVLEGWSDAPAGGTMYYGADGAALRAWDKPGDATLYAQWREKPKVTLHANGHRLGYVYDYQDASGQAVAESRYLEADESVQDHYDRAYIWDGTPYLLVDQSNPAGLYHVIREAEAGWTLKGWAESPAATEVLQAPYSTNEDGKGLYAIWRANAYEVALDANCEGEVDLGGPSPIAAAYGSDVELPRPARYGYAFMGWDTEPGGTGRRLPAGPNAAPNLTAQDGGRVVLYAQWALVTDVEVPVALDAVGFELGVPDGTVRVAGTADDPQAKAPGHLRSAMPVEVAVESVSCEAAADDLADPASPEAFWAEHAAYADLEVGPVGGAGGDDTADEASEGAGSGEGGSGPGGEGPTGTGSGGASAETGTPANVVAATAVDGPRALAATGALSLSAGDAVASPDVPSWLSIPAATGSPDGTLAQMGELGLLYGLSLDRLFADPSDGGAGVDILDLLPQATDSGFAVPTGLLRLTFTVDATRYA